MTRFDLRGARALVTGATGGIGQAIARELAAQGAELVLSGRRLDVLEPLAKELGATAIVAELSDLEDVDRLIEEAGPIDVLIANAALPSSGNVIEYTPEQITRSLTVNLHAPIRMARESAIRMSARGRGQIVLIGSVSGIAPSVASAMYNATKFGLRGFALGFRQDLQGTGVGLSIVEPGFVRDAGMFAESGGQLPKGMRTVTPEQVARKVVLAIRKDRAETVAAPIELRIGAKLTSVFPAVSARLQKLGGADKVAESIVEGQRKQR